MLGSGVKEGRGGVLRNGIGWGVEEWDCMGQGVGWGEGRIRRGGVEWSGVGRSGVGNYHLFPKEGFEDSLPLPLAALAALAIRTARKKGECCATIKDDM